MALSSTGAAPSSRVCLAQAPFSPRVICTSIATRRNKMVSLIASLYLVASGALGAAPVQVFTYGTTFDSAAACEDFRASDDSTASVELLRLAPREGAWGPGCP